MQILWRLITGAFFAGLIAGGPSARADRTVLGPNGDTLAPDSYRTEFALDPQSKFQNRVWLQYSTPQGIELETERLDLTGERKKGYALNIQYPITYSLVDTLPAISIGVRDLTGTGNEHGAFYIAATRTLALSDRQRSFVKEFKVDVGAGTGRIGGLFVGAQAHLTLGLGFLAELYKRQPNISVALPITRHLDARAYSLDSHLYYGLSFSVQR
jgi:hypothetical protein